MNNVHGTPPFSVPITNSLGPLALGGTPDGNNSTPTRSDEAGFEYQHYATNLPRTVSSYGPDGPTGTLAVVGAPPQMDHDETVRLARISLPDKGDLFIRFWASGEPNLSFFGYFFDLTDLRLRPIRPPAEFHVYQAHSTSWVHIPTFERCFQDTLSIDPLVGPEKYFVAQGTRLQIVYRDQPIAELCAPMHPRHLEALGTSVQAPTVDLQTAAQFGLSVTQE
ncbi:hypothetical protein EV361DRAFT_867310 [Lentinula raphanica]|nr:hypothetical protein C8R42DRAFT_640395 [Lentinula raphanica]KAJ3766167.1 hypothetical protein FB446DRAFT_758701 [Lentinula raphanica]KAJ3972944.1 hypothetical protein EV361DRAFT_867310 [Lentinula raphanica]